MDGARVIGLEPQGLPGGRLGPRVVAVFLQAERVHAEHIAIARHARVPVRQHLRDAVAQHFPVAEPKVERVGDLQRQAVARVFDDYRAVTSQREVRVAVEPGARGGGVAAFPIVGPAAERVELVQRSGQRRKRCGAAGEH